MTAGTFNHPDQYVALLAFHSRLHFHMGLTGFDFEMVSPVSSARMFKASVVDGHNLLPKIMPQIVSGAGIIKGDGGPGSIRQIRFTEVLPFSYVDEYIEVLDKDKLDFKFTTKETTRIPGRYISTTFHMKFVPTAEGGCICKTSAVYNTNGGAEATNEEIISGKEGVMGMFQGIEAYLIENPAAYA